jgi:hypothetical protein
LIFLVTFLIKQKNNKSYAKKLILGSRHLPAANTAQPQCSKLLSIDAIWYLPKAQYTKIAKQGMHNFRLKRDWPCRNPDFAGAEAV